MIEAVIRSVTEEIAALVMTGMNVMLCANWKAPPARMTQGPITLMRVYALLLPNLSFAGG